MNFALTKEQETLKKGLAILLEERGHVYGEGGISITPVFTEENKLINVIKIFFRIHVTCDI